MFTCFPNKFLHLDHVTNLVGAIRYFSLSTFQDNSSIFLQSSGLSEIVPPSDTNPSPIANSTISFNDRKPSNFSGAVISANNMSILPEYRLLDSHVVRGH